MNEKHIWGALIGRLGNPFAVAGLMGNLYAESALNPRNLQQSYEKKLGFTDDSYTAAVDGGTYGNFARDSAGYGLAQWTYWSRKEKLLAYARGRGSSIGDLDMQLDFLWEELHGYTALMAALLAAKSVREASDAVLTQYERPKDQSEAVKVKRAGFGQRYYDEFAKANESTNGGESMATNYKKYIMSTGAHYISNSGSDENGGSKGGEAGDQTGKEWQLRKWYNRPWTCVLRHPSIIVGTLLAQLGIDAALNNKIGYDQGQRDTYWKQLKAAGYLPKNITVACEEDCTAGVNANVHATGYLLDIPALKAIPETGVRSSNMRKYYSQAGFIVLTDSKYLTSGNYLLPGDILLYDNHHAATNVTKGLNVAYTYEDVIDNLDKYRGHITPEPAPVPTPSGAPDISLLGKRTLKKSMKGDDVKQMQTALLWLGYDLSKYGADGDFGGETEKAVREFQVTHNLTPDGVMHSDDFSVLFAALDGKAPEPPTPAPVAQKVEITGGSVNVRSAPGTKGTRVLGTVHKGDRLPYGGLTADVDGRDWYLVEYKNENGWVSSKYARVI